MEEARSLEPRRLTVEFRPQRMADAVLALAFKRLMEDREAAQTSEDSVQNEEHRECVQPCFMEETWQ